MLRFLAAIFFILTSLSSWAQGYNFVGNSSPAGGDCYTLTSAAPWQNGAIWYEDEININEPFSLQFTVSFGTLDEVGADGMVFVMQQTGNNVIGVPGGGMGFEGFSPSLGVEFDSFQNFDFGDPAYDHVAISTNGNPNHNLPQNIAGPVPISATSDNVEDGQDYIVDISWEPSLNQFTVSINCEIRLQVNISLQFVVFSGNPEVFWGFTGATGGEFNEQVVCLDPYILGLPETFDGCVGQPVQLEAPSASFGTVSWEPAEFLDDPNSFNPIATVDETTDFTLTFEDLCGNLQTEETTVVINEPSVDLGPDIGECDVNEVQITATGNYDDITWSDGSQGGSISVTESGTYWVDVVAGVCEASDTVDVNLDSGPIYDGDTNVNLCEGEEIMFVLPPNSGQIEWFDGSTAVNRMFGESGIYPFTLSDGECESEYEYVVEVADLSDFTIGPDINACEGNGVIINASGTYDSIIWSDDSEVNSINVSSSGTYWAEAFIGVCSASDTVSVLFNSTPEFDGETNADLCEGEEFEFDLGATNYDITWFDGTDDEQRTFDEAGVYPFELIDGECSAEFEIEIEVTPIPEFELGPDLTLCEGTTQLLLANAEESSISWSNGSSGSNISITEGGTYWALAENNGCSFSDTVEVVFTPKPNLNLSGTESLCPDEEGMLLAESNAPLIWSTGETDLEIIVDRPGQYTVIATNEAECTTQETIFVNGLELPRIDPLEDLVICQEKGFVVATAESSDNPSLIWSNGSTGSLSRIMEEGDYIVELENECGLASDEFTVELEECFDLFFLPSAFTPDGDGLNDLFKPEISTHVSYEIRIFNRNGEVVFESKDPNKGWNGSFMNNDFFCPAGIYAVRYSIDFGENDIQEGFASVVLIR